MRSSLLTFFFVVGEVDKKVASAHRARGRNELAREARVVSYNSMRFSLHADTFLACSNFSLLFFWAAARDEVLGHTLETFVERLPVA
jgi:hypothetical protein